MPEAYLTIDDSPSPYTEALLDFLKERGLQALFFCRGHLLDDNPDPMIRAVKEGHIVANHGYSHTPAGELGVEAVMDEITRTEGLIDEVYARAGVLKPGPYFRFPYLDRGNGTKSEQHYDDLIANGIGAHRDMFEAPEVRALQDWLKAQGYTQPFGNITHPLYQIPEIRDAADCLLTYTSYDWMLTPRHKGKEIYKTLDDLKTKIDNDPYLLVDNAAHVVLFHDDREGILPEVCDLIDYMMRRGVTFKQYE